MRGLCGDGGEVGGCGGDGFGDYGGGGLAVVFFCGESIAPVGTVFGVVSGVDGEGGGEKGEDGEELHIGL